MTAGRLRIYFEPRDAWSGMYVAKDAIYICPVPFLVLRWQRGPQITLRWDSQNGWYCGTPGLMVWGYRTPWGAWHGHRGLKKLRQRRDFVARPKDAS
jgi:hypothetical protein